MSVEIKEVIALQKDTFKWQLVLNAIVALVFGYFANLHAACSVLLGMTVVMIGSFVGALVAQQAKSRKTPGSILMAILKGELVKIAIIATFLLLIFKFYVLLVPIALIIGLAITALMAGKAFVSTNL
jgi:F0F1-type ATP synthase assembly protein I